MRCHRKIDYDVWNKTWDIIGVIKDFHQKSLHYAMEPVIFLPFYGSDNPISVKLKTKDLTSTIDSSKQNTMLFSRGIYLTIILSTIISMRCIIMICYSEKYLPSLQASRFSSPVSVYWDLSLFTTAQRTKEIGVRKVLGASVPNIVFLLSKDFMRLIVISFLIASPVAW